MLLRKPCSGYKMKEMTGSGIFLASAEDTTSEANGANPDSRTSIRVYQVHNMISLVERAI